MLTVSETSGDVTWMRVIRSQVGSAGFITGYYGYLLDGLGLSQFVWETADC